MCHRKSLLLLMFPKKGLTICVPCSFFRHFMLYISGSLILQVRFFLRRGPSGPSNDVEIFQFAVTADDVLNVNRSIPLTQGIWAWNRHALKRAESVPIFCQRATGRRGKRRMRPCRRCCRWLYSYFSCAQSLKPRDLIYHESDGSGLYTSLTNIKASWNWQREWLLEHKIRTATSQDKSITCVFFQW